MKTNFYLVDYLHSNCVPTFVFSSTRIVVISNEEYLNLFCKSENLTYFLN